MVEASPTQYPVLKALPPMHLSSLCIDAAVTSRCQIYALSRQLMHTFALLQPKLVLGFRSCSF